MTKFKLMLNHLIQPGRKHDIGSLSNDDGNAKDDCWKKNGLKFYFWISQLSRTVQQAEWSKTLLKLKK